MASSLIVRTVRVDDYPLIQQAVRDKLQKILAKGKKQWVQMVDPGHVVVTLMNDPDVLVLNDSVLIYAQAGAPWYAPHSRVLMENLILRLKPSDTTMSDVVETLKLWGRDSGCTMLVVGTALADDAALRAIYEQEGFVPGSIELTLEI